MLLGCIGDDFTGSSDLANTLAKQGMRTVQYTGVPTTDAPSNIEAGVVALKSRSNDPKIAVEQSLKALDWLKRQGCKQFFFKYCSTFDSTPKGNIGPVIDALALALDAHKIIVCPAFPGTGRSIYQGHLFVNDVLLNECGMQDHPVTPMIDADIRRWLKPQTAFNVGHVAAPHVLNGADAIKSAMRDEHEKGNRIIVVDALQDADLMEIGIAAADLPLISGGSGVALGLPANFKNKGLATGKVTAWTKQSSKCIVLSGSCSKATRAQVEFHSKTNPSFEIIASDVIEGKLKAETVAKWLVAKEGVPLAYSSADPEVVRSVQQQYGNEKSAEAIESFFTEVSRQLVENGIECILTAGGETSGAVVEGLQLNELEIGPEIDPGVPALRAGPNLVLALKSGNFGAEDYFAKAARMLTSKN
ncbi:MAG: four-carbon acid sugar kinase family protein [Rhizobiales bacterium]|nr:four-carbon acid sugar kinase family protein [Hyphomicrobiales bacterium]